MGDSSQFLQLQLKNLCGFEEGRIHATFSDNTSLILQNNNYYITYFFNNGEKVRSELTTIPNRDDMKSKVYDVIKKNNFFNDKAFVDIEDMYSSEEKVLLLNKITYCNWAISHQSVENNLKIFSDRSIEFRAIDNMASIRLLENGMVFEVEYLQLLPKKKPMWVNKLLYEDKFEDSFNFTKDFLSSVGPKSSFKTEKNVMKMGYEYIKMRKRFSIFNFPSQWAYPLLIVFERFEEQLNQAGLTVRHRPKFPMEFLTWFENIDNIYLSEDGSSVEGTECGLLGILKASPDIIATVIPGSDATLPDEKKVITRKDVWNDDNINPLSNLYSKELKPHHQISENFIFWLTDTKEVLIWVQDDNSVILSSQEGKYYNHFYRNVKASLDQNTLDNYELKFSIDSIPPMTRSKKKSGCMYSLTEAITQAMKLVTNAKLSELNNSKYSSVNTLESKDKPDETYKTMPFELFHQSKNGYGIFEAYKNKSIKVVFTDRTVLRINFGQDVASILTKTGDKVEVRLDRPNEFEEYVKIAMEYYENVFTDAKTKLERMKESAVLNDMISFELEKNERFLRVTTGNIPNMPITMAKSTYIEPGYTTPLMNRSMHESFIKEEMSANLSMRDLYGRPTAVSETYFDIDELNRQIQEQMRLNETMLKKISYVK